MVPVEAVSVEVSTVSRSQSKCPDHSRIGLLSKSGFSWSGLFGSGLIRTGLSNSSKLSDPNNRFGGEGWVYATIFILLRVDVEFGICHIVGIVYANKSTILPGSSLCA